MVFHTPPFPAIFSSAFSSLQFYATFSILAFSASRVLPACHTT